MFGLQSNNLSCSNSLTAERFKASRVEDLKTRHNLSIYRSNKLKLSEFAS